MKKKSTLILVLFLNIIYICYSQDANNPNPQKAESVHAAYVTKELALTADEAKSFWPLYNNYRDEIRSVRRDKETDQIALEEKVLNIRKKYKDDFKKVLGTDDRVNKLFLTEKNFREILRKELIQRRAQRQEKKPG